MSLKCSFQNKKLIYEWRYEGVLLEFVKFLLEINILVLELLKLLLE